MKSIRIPGLCLVAMFLVSMVAAGSASAEQKLPPKPFFAQCQKTKEAGNAEDSQCSKGKTGEWIEVVGGETECRETLTKEAGHWTDPGCKTSGKGDFIKIAEPVETFSSTSGIGTLETVTAGKVTCKKDTNRGRIIGPSQVRLFVSFTECKTKIITEVACENINTRELSGQLRYIKAAAPTEVGLQLKPTTGEIFTEFECEGGVKIKVKGAVIGVITSALNTYSRTGTLRFKQTKGIQEPENFEGGAKEILESENNITNKFEQAGEETSDNIQFQDDTQIIA